MADERTNSVFLGATGLAICLVAVMLGNVYVMGRSPVPDQVRRELAMTSIPNPAVSLSAKPDESVENVVDVRVKGRKRVALHMIQSKIQTRAGRPFDEELIENDVRRLYKTGWFVTVRPETQRVPEGRVVIFDLLERPLIRHVKYCGNDRYVRSRLEKEADIKPGEAMNLYSVEEARRRLEEFYHDSGFSRARVALLEGNKPDDLDVIFLINEGGKPRVWHTEFIGNTIVGDLRLKAKIKSKPGFFWIFGGKVSMREIDEDVVRLTEYYRDLGFGRARVGRQIGFDDEQQWVTLTFVIDEGPRYRIRNVSFLGNTKFSTEQLQRAMNLQPGMYFNKIDVLHDESTLRDTYGSVGYLGVRIQANPRYLEEPGQLDLVYNIHEGPRCLVGKIEPSITGEAPHTRVDTVLNRISFVPGDVADIREFRNSERRLQASKLFETNPQMGPGPTISYQLPDMDGRDIQQAGHEANFRGQSPENYPPTSARPLPRASVPGPSSAPIVRGQYSVDAGQNVAPVRSASTYDYSNPLRTDTGYQTSPNYATPSTPPNYATPSNLPPVSTPPPAPPPSNLPAVQSPWPNTTPSENQAFTPSENQAFTPIENQAFTPIENQAFTPIETQPYTPTAPPAVQSFQPDTTRTYTPVADTQPNVSRPDDPAYSTASQPYSYQGTQTPSLNSSPPPTRPPPGQLAPPSYETTPGGFLGAPSNDYNYPPNFDSSPGRPVYEPPPIRVPLTPEVRETQTGRFMLSVGVNSDAGVMGSVIIDEQNFNLLRVPRSWQDFHNGLAFRGGGQRFRAEAVPGTEVQKYMLSLQEPYLFNTRGSGWISGGVSGHFFNRRYREWNEERIGGRLSLGYQFTHDLSGTLAYRGEKIAIYNPIVSGIPELDSVLGDNSLHGFSATISHDTRDNSFMPTQGHLLELSFEQVLGTYEYPRAELDFRRYFMMHQRPDRSGRHVMSLAGRIAVTGSETPIYEHYYAGGFSSLRGFDFRGVTPRDPAFGVGVGGEFMLLGSLEYMFPITADDSIRGVIFCDTGTVESTLDDWESEYRVAPGFGLRVTVPAMGPAPIALDFGFPLSSNRGDDERIFSFFVGFLR